MGIPTLAQRRKLVGIGNYQFGNGVGQILFGKSVRIECSRKTGRIRHVFVNDQLIATLRPKDGYLALTTHGASIILSRAKNPPNIVSVETDVSEAIQAGGDVFAKHVVRADPELRPADEAIVTDQRGALLGVGRAVLSGVEMMDFKRGVAVKLRRGVEADT
jgi:predicted RNA-binding protein (TIGR00451 family)